MLLPKSLRCGHEDVAQALCGQQDAAVFWCRINRDDEVCYEFAQASVEPDYAGLVAIADRVLSLHDETTDSRRVMGFVNNQLVWGLATAVERSQLCASDALANLLRAQQADWLALSLADLSAVDTSAVFCSCHDVRTAAIQDALNAGCCTIEELGRDLACGTNCGSCLPELRALVSAHMEAAGPEPRRVSQA